MVNNYLTKKDIMDMIMEYRSRTFGEYINLLEAFIEDQKCDTETLDLCHGKYMAMVELVNIILEEEHKR